MNLSYISKVIEYHFNYVVNMKRHLFINKWIILQKHCPQLAGLFEAGQYIQNMQWQWKTKANKGKFTVYIILTIVTCRRQQQKRHYYPTILCYPWSSKSRFFLVYWLYFKSKFFSIICVQATRMPPRDFPFWEKSQGQILKKKTVEVNNTVKTTSLNNSHVLNTKLQVSIWFTRF